MPIDFPYTTDLIVHIPAIDHGLPPAALHVEVLRCMPGGRMLPEPMLAWCAVDGATGDVEVHFVTNAPDDRRGLIRLSTREETD